MAYLPVTSTNPDAVAFAGVASLIEKWTGLKLSIVSGGPSTEDPAGLHRCFVALRDTRGRYMYITVGHEGMDAIHAGEYRQQAKQVWPEVK